MRTDRERLDEIVLREGRVKHALKTALACCLAATLTYYFHLANGQMSAVFAFMLLTLGMPTPRLNWLMSHVTTTFSSLVSGLILIAFHDAPVLYVSLTLLWIFICVLFANWFPLPASLAAMSSAIGLFMGLETTIGATLDFFVDYQATFFMGGFSTALFYTLLWPASLQKTFMKQLVQVYARLEDDCRMAADRIRSGAPFPEAEALEDWAPFRPLRKLLAPRPHRSGDSVDPFVQMIVGCRNLNLRLWFFKQAIAPALLQEGSPEGRRRLAGILEQCADHLHGLAVSVRLRQAAAMVPDDLIQQANFANFPKLRAGIHDPLLEHGIQRVLLHRLVDGLQSVTHAQNAVLMALKNELPGELLAIKAFAVGKPLLDDASIRAATKLLVILVLLLVEELFFGFPGGTQVAFFAVFFASTANLGRQNRTDILGVTGLFTGFMYGVLAAILTTRLPYFPLLLLLVFLGEFVANMMFQALPKYGVAGLQGGLAIPFALLAATGPAWGSFVEVRTRFAGLVVAGCTAIVVHAYLWPVLPMRQLRTALAGALRESAESLRLLFANHAAWDGPPASLGETFHQAHDLLEDARFLPGIDHADPNYNKIVSVIQQIDAYLSYIQMLLSLEGDADARGRLFQTASEEFDQMAAKLEQVAKQFALVHVRAAQIAPLEWKTNVSSRWQQAGSANDPEENQRLLVIASCLDQIAQAVTTISRDAAAINRDAAAHHGA